MPANKIVVHDKVGNVLKGTTADFLPKRPWFHLAVSGTPGEEIKKIRLVFNDGETVSGYTHVFNMDQHGFFLIPLDPKSNNERIFIVFSSLSALEVDGSPIKLTR